MKLYQAIIWISLLLIIGEGVIISGYQIYPAASLQKGIVLGESTNAVLDEASDTAFPASYYILDTEIKGSTAATGKETMISLDQEQEMAEVARFLQKQTPFISKDSANGKEELVNGQTPEVDKLVEWLNTGNSEQSVYQGEAEASEDRIRILINKNKRFYLKNIKKEVEAIRQGLDER